MAKQGGTRLGVGARTRALLAERRSVRLAGGWLRCSWATVLVVVISMAVAFFAFVNPGEAATDLHLDEGSVYVQNQGRAMVGGLNYQIDQIAAATSVGDTATTLLQEDGTVLVNNAGSSTLQIYDPATNTLSSPVTPPVDAQLSLNNGVLAVTNPENGKVWFGPVDEIARSDFKGNADLDLGDWGQAVVTTDGEVIGLNVQDSTIVRPDGSVVEIPFQVDSSSPTAQLSAIGDKAVVLDRTSQQIWVEGDRQAVTISSGSTAQLAPPMPNTLASGRGGSAIYATQAGLNTIADGAPASLSGSMDASPTEPVVVNGCAYGAFETRVVKVCTGGEPEIQDIPQLPADADLQFQVNRGIVVLQDVSSGIVWLVDKDMLVVDNWEEVAPSTQTRQSDPNPPDDRTTLPDRTQANRAPVALDDPDLGARAGRSTRLSILDNDSDEDGDIITVSEVSSVEGATLELTGNGSGLQITLPADATGTHQFTYTISDGRGGTASATATVKVLPADQSGGNTAPENIRPGETLIVGSGTTASKRVLLTWRDPDGDDLVLVNALPETNDSEDEVTFTPDGTVTFRDVGKTTGTKKVRVFVSDGTTQVEGILLVDVRERGQAPPIANGDFVTTMVDREVVVSPLDNDEGNNLMLTEIDQSTQDFTVTPNYPEGTFTFRSSSPGTYYLTYKVNNGSVSSGLIRVDVLPTTDENHAPVALRDVALVPFGGSVVIDPLLNDTDADNDVLVVQSITQNPAVKVVMQERHLLTISMVTHTDTPIALTYWVSDGRNSTPGTIVVFPSPEAGSHLPRAENDTVKVRAGATVSVPVLDNDVSPVGLDLTVSGLPDNPLGDLAWVDGDYVRIQVPAATAMSLTYEITDSAGMADAATISVTVISADAQNEAPVPELVTARVLSNSVTTITIPLTGIDPNGDATRLLGLGSGPSLGRIVEVGDGWLRYEAYQDSRGTDTFRYQVVDSLGAVGTGEIRIGVAPPSDDNTAPTGVPDEVTVRPGRSLTLPVMANDYDIDGDQFGFLDTDSLDADFEATVTDDQYVSVVAPSEPGDYVGQYYLMDSRGSTGSGLIYLHVDEDAPLLAPEANDDQVVVNDIIDQEWVDVDVLANDFDVDGPRSELVVSLPGTGSEGSQVEATVVDGKVSVHVSDQMQQVRYTITDADGNSAEAVIVVPGRNDSVPVLALPDAENSVEAGKVLTINFDTMLLGTQGRSVRLTSADTVKATKGTVNIRPEGIDFQADVRYAGPASVVFEVIDDTDPTDKTARRAYISVSITVTPADSGDGSQRDQDSVSNRAPEGPSQITLEVGAGESDQQFPLRGRFSDPEGDNFSFQSWEQVSGDGGVSWSSSVGGDTIVARGGMTNKGSQVTLRGHVVDAYGAGREVTVIINVIGSTRPLPVAQTDTVDDADAGRPRSVPVLANDRSYLEGDQSLKVLSARVVSGTGSASVSGDDVVVTPGDDFVGTMTVSYTIVDATGDTARQVDGVIQLNVRARPSKPGVPTIEEEGNKQVTLKWTSNSSNGLPVIERVVTATGANGSQVVFDECEANVCTVTGLTNDLAYTFHVQEGNELGLSDASGESAAGTPDVKPPKVSTPTLEFPGANRPGELRLTWSAPQFEGSAVSEYTITSSDGSVPTVTVPAGTTSYTFTGLTNYASYQFTVSATNKKGTSDPSNPSNVEHPSAAPPSPAAPTVYDTNDWSGQSLDVQWTVPPQQGDQFTVYLVAQGGGREIVQQVDAGSGGGTTRITGLSRRTEYRVFVRITTRGGTTDGPSSSSVTTTAAPENPATGTISASAPDTITFTLGGNSGQDWDYALVELVGTGQQPVSLQPGESHRFTVSDYYTDVHVRTTAVASANSGPKTGATWDSESARAYGTPTIGVTHVGYTTDNKAVFRVGSVQANGTNWQITTPAGGWEGQDFEVETGGKQVSTTVEVCDTGHSGNCSTATATAKPALAASGGKSGALTITINDTSAPTWVCSVGGWSGNVASGSEQKITVTPTPEAGKQTLTCNVPWTDREHSVDVTFS